MKITDIQDRVFNPWQNKRIDTLPIEWLKRNRVSYSHFTSNNDTATTCENATCDEIDSLKEKVLLFLNNQMLAEAKPEDISLCHSSWTKSCWQKEIIVIFVNWNKMLLWRKKPKKAYKPSGLHECAYERAYYWLGLDS